MPLINGDFSSGLKGWTPLIQNATDAQVTSKTVYSCLLQAKGVMPGNNVNGISQSITPPMAVPLVFTASFVVTKTPIATLCNHPYNQFSLYQTKGPVLEFGVSQISPGQNPYIWLSYNGRFYVNQPITLGVKHDLKLLIRKDFLNFLLDGVLVEVLNNFSWVDVRSVQIVASCDGVWSVSDIGLVNG